MFNIDQVSINWIIDVKKMNNHIKPQKTRMLIILVKE